MECLGLCLLGFIFVLGTPFPSQALFGHFHESTYGFLENNVICRFNLVNTSAEYWLRLNNRGMELHFTQKMPNGRPDVQT